LLNLVPASSPLRDGARVDTRGTAARLALHRDRLRSSRIIFRPTSTRRAAPTRPACWCSCSPRLRLDGRGVAAQADPSDCLLRTGHRGLPLHHDRQRHRAPRRSEDRRAVHPGHPARSFLSRILRSFELRAEEVLFDDKALAIIRDRPRTARFGSSPNEPDERDEKEYREKMRDSRQRNPPARSRSTPSSWR
jgi:hypothetical protein